MAPLFMGIVWAKKTVTLTIRRIIWDDGKPSRDPEDYAVRFEDRDVGRIYRTVGLAGARIWKWSVYPLPSGAWGRGDASDLDEAKEAFKATWERVSAQK